MGETPIIIYKGTREEHRAPRNRTIKEIRDMRLNELLKKVKPLAIIGADDIDISGVNIDSRKIKDGHLFVAMKGTQVDGHKFIGKAIEQGAKAVLVEDMPEERTEGVTYVQVASTEDAVVWGTERSV